MFTLKGGLNVKKGFTLLEIMLVIAIIGILSAIVVLAVNPSLAIKKTRDAVRYSDIRSLNNAINQYIIDHGHAPYLQDNCSPAQADPSCFTNEVPKSSPYEWKLLQEDLSEYIQNIPQDPCGEKCFAKPKYYAYAYYSPAYFYSACIKNGMCGKFPKMTSIQAEAMYSIYAENLETAEGAWGMFRNQFQSF